MNAPGVHVACAPHTSKTKFDFLNRSWNARHGARDIVGTDNGRDKIGTYVRTDPDTVVGRLVERLVRSPPRMTLACAADIRRNAATALSARDW